MRTDQTSTGTRVDHFGRSTPPTPTCGSSWADRGENSEPGETHPRKRRLTPAIRELQRGRITPLSAWCAALSRPGSKAPLAAWYRVPQHGEIGKLGSSCSI